MEKANTKSDAMSIKERLAYARERGRHYIHCTRFHPDREPYCSSSGYLLVFDYFMGVRIDELHEWDAKYLREILANDGRPGR